MITLGPPHKIFIGSLAIAYPLHRIADMIVRESNLSNQQKSNISTALFISLATTGLLGAGAITAGAIKSHKLSKQLKPYKPGDKNSPQNAEIRAYNKALQERIQQADCGFFWV